MKLSNQQKTAVKAAAMGLMSLAILASANRASAGDDPIFQLPFAKNYSGTSVERLRKALESVQSDNRVLPLLSRGSNKLAINQVVTGAMFETTKFQDYYKGLEVVGSMAFHHANALGVTQVTTHLARFDLDVKPTISLSQVAALARNWAGPGMELDETPILKVLPGDDNASAQLVYWVSIRDTDRMVGSDMIIDAHSGAVIADMSHHQELAPRAQVQVYQTNADCQVVDEESGVPLSINVPACDQTVINGRPTAKADSSAVQAAKNAAAVLNYYAQRHGRNGFDGKGADSVNLVHIGTKFDNAFWDSKRQIMAYGDGDGVETSDFTTAVDVAGHEMTHAVTSATAGLLYYGEYGALNEAFSDFFGKMIANDGDWAIGKEIFLKGEGRRTGVRDLEDPSRVTFRVRGADGEVQERPMPAHMKDKMPTDGMCGRGNDNCYVHANATIPGHASYLVAQKIGRAKAEKLYYQTLTQAIGPRESFRNLADDMLTVCKQMMYAETTCADVKSAFEEVGL